MKKRKNNITLNLVKRSIGQKYTSFLLFKKLIKKLKIIDTFLLCL